MNEEGLRSLSGGKWRKGRKINRRGRKEKGKGKIAHADRMKSYKTGRSAKEKKDK